MILIQDASHECTHWIPACAGMTVRFYLCLSVFICG